MVFCLFKEVRNVNAARAAIVLWKILIDVPLNEGKC